MSIQWFPGHMHATQKAIVKRLPDIDVVIELLDARLQARYKLDSLDGLTGDSFDAATALRLGLVHRVCEPAELDAAVAQQAQQLASLGPQVLRQQKALLRDWERLPLDEAIERSVGEFGRAFATGEPQEHMNRFLAREG